MKKSILLLIMSACLLTVACQKSSPAKEEEPQKEQEFLELTSNAPNGGTPVPGSYSWGRYPGGPCNCYQFLGIDYTTMMQIWIEADFYACLANLPTSPCNGNMRANTIGTWVWVKKR